ncbi:MAG: hypothetical protein HFI88_14205 [Lachnospiraceae bacterium]|nr:hypothetical protein [Lachnospiraceae bacterium]
MKVRKQKLLALLTAAAMALTPMASAGAVHAGDAVAGNVSRSAEDVQKVEALIGNLPILSEVTEANRSAIEAALTAYNALSEEERKQVDEDTGDKSSQSYGRDLETAVWGLEALKGVDNSTSLADGTYSAATTPALSSTYSKGKSNSSRQKPWSLKEVKVENGKAFATVTVESTSYTQIRTNGAAYPKTNTSGNSEFANVPVDLNGTMYLAATSSSMNGEIAFTVTNTIKEPTVVPADNITNNTGMFKVIDAFITELADGKALYITLSGTGYHELFKGTYDQAVATGDDSSNWIVGTVRDDGKGFDGKYQFAIPISDNDGYIQIQALSHSHKKDGWWWYPRYIRLDQSALTLETGDYKETFDLKVTNNVKMFSVKGAEMTIDGGPHSNSYKITSDITMGSASFDKAYIGTAEEAGAAAETIALTADHKFQFMVEHIVGTGNAATIQTILEKPTVFSFHSVRNDAWYERVLTFDKNEKTLVINDSNNQGTGSGDNQGTGSGDNQDPAHGQHTHTFGAWKTVAEATVFAAEKRERVCTVCGEKETEESGKPLTPTIKLNVTKITLQTGQSTTKVKVSGLAKGDSVKNWTTKDTGIVKVDKKTGKITALKKKGKAAVTVTLASGKTAKVTVTVQKGTVKTDRISGLKKSVTLEPGKKLTLKPVISPITSQQKVSYTSSDRKVADVSKKGVVTAKKSGTAKITVKSGSKKVVVTVKVPKKSPTAIKNIPSAKTLKKGKTLTLKPKFSPSGSTAKVTYTSSDKKVASVNAKGKITAKKKGTAVITVKAGKLKKQCKITVK